MVRLEKLVWEQMVNLKQLKRARTLATPSKWYSENRFDAMQVAAQRVYLSGISGAIFRVVEPFFARFTWQTWNSICAHRGLALEDFFLHQDRELRRCFIWEKMMRDGCHPYSWVFFKRRRARYYKIERAVRGFTAPDYIVQEGKNRLFSETVENKEIWENYVYKEYMSDMTPNFHWSVLGKWTVLDLIQPHGLWRAEAYDRYFLNEAYYDEYTQEDVDTANNAVFSKNFEDEVKRFNKLYPGAIARQGEEFDFERYYASKAIASGQDTSKFDSSLVANLNREIAEANQTEDVSAGNKSGKAIGRTTPGFVQRPAGSGYFAK